MQSFYIASENPESEENKKFSQIKSIKETKTESLNHVSLGIVLDEKRGMFFSVVKGAFSNKFCNRDHTLLMKTYMNLEALACELMKSEDRNKLKK